MSLSVPTLSRTGAILLLLGASHMTLAAPQGEGQWASTVRVEAQQTGSVRLDHVEARSGNGALRLTGHLHRPYASRARIPGHYHITAYGDGDTVLAHKTYRWGRMPFRSRLLKFMVDLPIDPERARSISIVHHHAGEPTG